MSTVRSTSIAPDLRIEEITSVDSLRRHCDQGLLAQWDDLANSDPYANFNQSHAWCMAWYQTYHASFAPLVLTATRGDELCGIAPLARHLQTGRLTFAGDNLCDYRDVVANDTARSALLSAVLDCYRRTKDKMPFRIGATQADSPTGAMVRSLSGGRLVRSGSEACYQLTFSAEALQKISKKKWIRYSLNQYRKEGPVTLEVITSATRWQEIRELLFDHHTLRQLQASRRTSLNDPAKRAFYDALVLANPSPMHVAVLHVGDRIVAEHCGYVWRDQIGMGVPAFNPLDERYSPGLVLLSLLFHDVATTGLTGVDFTPGLESYKQRLSSSMRELPTIDVFCQSSRFLRSELRRWCAARVQPLRHRILSTRLLGAFARRGPAEASRKQPQGMCVEAEPALKGAAHQGRVFVSEIDREACNGKLEGREIRLHRDDVAALARWSVPEARIKALLQYLSAASHEGETVYTMTLNGALLGWARTRIADSSAIISSLALAPGSRLILGFRFLGKDPAGLRHALRTLVRVLPTSDEPLYLLSSEAILFDNSGTELRPVSEFETETLTERKEVKRYA